MHLICEQEKLLLKTSQRRYVYVSTYLRARTHVRVYVFVCVCECVMTYRGIFDNNSYLT